MQRDTTPGVVGDDGSVEIQVANKRIKRLIELGVHVEKTARLKAARRHIQRQSRRTNRRNK